MSEFRPSQRAVRSARWRICWPIERRSCSCEMSSGVPSTVTRNAAAAAMSIAITRRLPAGKLSRRAPCPGLETLTVLEPPRLADQNGVSGGHDLPRSAGRPPGRRRHGRPTPVPAAPTITFPAGPTPTTTSTPSSSAARRPTATWASCEYTPSSSISPSTAIRRPGVVVCASVSAASIDVGFALYASTQHRHTVVGAMHFEPQDGRRPSQPRRRRDRRPSPVRGDQGERRVERLAPCIGTRTPASVNAGRGGGPSRRARIGGNRRARPNGEHRATAPRGTASTRRPRRTARPVAGALRPARRSGGGASSPRCSACANRRSSPRRRSPAAPPRTTPQHPGSARPARPHHVHVARRVGEVSGNPNSLLYEHGARPGSTRAAPARGGQEILGARLAGRATHPGDVQADPLAAGGAVDACSAFTTSATRTEVAAPAGGTTPGDLA